jgi:hypothetical protein
MTPAQRRARRIVGALIIALGLAVAGSAFSSVVWVYLLASQCPPGDASCGGDAPLLLWLAMVPGGFGVLLVGIGLLVRRAGRRRPGDAPFVLAYPAIDRATKYRATVTALVFVGAVACWAFGVRLWGGGFALMGALFAVTTALMHKRKLL